MSSVTTTPPRLVSGFPMRDDQCALSDPARTWSRDECDALFHRIVGMTTREGETSVSIRVGGGNTLRWAQNRPTLVSMGRNQQVIIQRVIGNVSISTRTSTLDDDTLKQVVARAERRVKQVPVDPDRPPTFLAPAQQFARPALWSDTTFNVTLQRFSDTVQATMAPIRDARLLASGALGTSVETWAIFNTKGLAAYVAGTGVQYSETIRTSDGTGSGWTGLSGPDWAKLDVATLSARAMERCVASANPKAIEPGRYTVILQPDAVAALMFWAVWALDRGRAEAGFNPYSGGREGETKIGQRVLDERITISTDPADPDAPYIPFDGDGYSYRPVTWIENGVLKQLAYDSAYASDYLGTQVPLPNPYAFRMSGGETSVEEMIATTERGVLVTKLFQAFIEDQKSALVSAVTQDGVWLVEHGRIKTPVKNMTVLESPLFIGNRILQLGKPVRVFGPRWSSDSAAHSVVGDAVSFTPQAFGPIPIVVPPMKVTDFNFANLVDAV